MSSQQRFFVSIAILVILLAGMFATFAYKVQHPSQITRDFGDGHRHHDGSFRGNHG